MNSRTKALAVAFFMVAGCDQLTGRGAQGAEDGSTMVEPTALPQRYVVQESRFGFAETLGRLHEAIDRRDLTVFAVIDHAAGAQSVDLEMPPATVIIFGSPKIGTPLMLAEPQLAAELPLRAAVFEDDGGTVRVAVTSAAALPRLFETLAPEASRISAINDNLRALMDEATGQ